MNQELEFIAGRLASALSPEDVFGEINARTDELVPLLKQSFRSIAKVAHPDVYQTWEDKALAQTTFGLLASWFDQAKQKIAAGEYGRRNTSPKTVLCTKRHEFTLEHGHVEEQVFNFYPCSFVENGRRRQAVLKVVCDPYDNDLAGNEIRALQTLARGVDANKYSPYIPKLVDAFLYDDAGAGRQALVLEGSAGWFSLEDVHHAYPYGIDPKDMAWMWRRLLVVLGFSHNNKILHGAVLPKNIWILPEQHGLMLMNWICALRDPELSGEHVAAVDSEYADWYPQEILKGGNPSFGTDISMSAKCMLWLLGGDPQKRVLPESVPAPIKAFFKGCILPAKRAPQDAWKLKQEFDELIELLWGERTFHPFSIK